LIEGASNSLVTANDIRYNNGMGVRIESGASNNIIGGDVITSLNIIGNNGGYGVELYGSTTTGNVVKNNDILNNGIDGVFIGGDAHDNEIGSDVIQSANLIRYNNGSGIGVSDSGPNTISYNGIVGNGKYGVILDGSLTQGNTITGTSITGNGYDGIGEGNGAGANFWNKVSIFGNGGLGIDKGASSDTTNIINAPALTIDSVNRSTGVVRGRATGSLLLVIDEIGCIA
jgi:parallel beta-helix repeat protein